MEHTANSPNSPRLSVGADTLCVMTGPDTYLMKPGEVRDLLRIGRTTLHEWREAGRLTAIRHTPKGPWLYPADQPIIVRALHTVQR